jgi:two-component system, OmpR family, response regulator TctD
MRVLLAEDEHALGEWLSKALAQSGIQVDWVDDGQLAERALNDADYDALILDLGLPGLSGRQLLQRLRARDRRLPVLILTARDSLAERVQVLNQGADDFLAKPFAIEELEARLTALVRRARGAENPRLACGALQYDTASRQFTLNDAVLHLSPREHAVLRALIHKTGTPLSKAQIIARVFSDEEDVLPDVIEVLVHRLRKRLEGSGLAIVTYRGLGYALDLAA